MERVKVDDPNMLLRRYETLKKQYFSPTSRRKIDDEGQEVPNALDRSVIIRQFENLGCEVPISPDQPFTPLQYQTDER